MRFSAFIAACAVTLTTLAVAAAVGAGPASARPTNPAPAPPMTFPTIQLNTTPAGVAVDPTTHMVYVANPENDNGGLVSVIDAADSFSPPVLLEQLPVAGDPTAIGVDTSTHMVYAASENGLTMIDGATTPPTVGAIIPLGGVPGQVAVDSATHTVYVTEFSADDVKVINAAVNPPAVTTLAYPEIVDTPLGVAVDPTTHLAYVTEINDDLLAVIDGADNPPQVIHTVHLGDPATLNNGGADPDAVGVDPTTHTVYVANGNGTVQTLNGYEITGGLKLGTYPYSYPDGVAVDPSTHLAYVTDGIADTVSLVKAGSPPTVTATLPVGDFPLGIGVDPTTHTAFVSNNLDTTVSVVGPPTIIATPPVGSLPEGTIRLAYTTTVAAYGGGGTYNWTATGLPPGLSINPTTGTISGYPTVTGTFQVTVTVTAPLGSASREFSLTVAAPPKTIGCQPGKCV